RPQGRLRRERQGRQRRPAANRAVIRTIGHAASGVAQQWKPRRRQCSGRIVWAVAGGQTPAILGVATEGVWIASRVFALHLGGAPAVLEIVAVLLAHEGVAYATKIDPGVRELVDEEGPGVEEVDVVDIFPLVGGGPRRIVAEVDGMRRRAKRQY